MRRLLFALLFPLLLIAQQGAFVHSLQHLAGSAATSGKQDDGHPAGEQYCEKCFAFAHIGAAAGSVPAPVPVLAAAFEAIGLRLPITPPAQVRIARSRGPPSLL
jgi:hypothetical protein